MRFAATLPASDIERARAWYASVLQLEPVHIDEFGDLWYETGGSDFVVYSSRFAGTNQATAATILVPDVEAAMADLRSRGAVFEDYDFGDDFRTVDGVLTTAEGRKAAWFKDSEGNILALDPAAP